MERTTYRELCDKFFDKIKDRMFIELDEATSYEIAVSYIAPACGQFQDCKQPLEDRDDDIQEFMIALTPSNKEILVNYMVIEWLDSNYIRTTSALKARLSSADFHSLSQSNMLGKALELRAALKDENDQIAINKSYLDSRIFELTIQREKGVQYGTSTYENQNSPKRDKHKR